MKVTVQAPAGDNPDELPDMGPESDRPQTSQGIRPGTVGRIVPFAKPYRWQLLFLVTASALGAVVTAAGPLLFGVVIDKGNRLVPGQDLCLPNIMRNC